VRRKVEHGHTYGETSSRHHQDIIKASSRQTCLAITVTNYSVCVIVLHAVCVKRHFPLQKQIHNNVMFIVAEIVGINGTRWLWTNKNEFYPAFYEKNCG
jgi:hypothetical protein